MQPYNFETLEIRNYDVRHEYGVDWVTCTTYITDKSLTIEEFNNIVKESHTPWGELRYRKFKQTYSDGSVYYKHVLEEVMY